MRVGDMVKFVNGKIVGFVVQTTSAPDVVRVLWLRTMDIWPARIDRLEVISEGG